MDGEAEGNSAPGAMSSPEPLHFHHEWLDQARGFVVIMFICSTITASLGGDVFSGDPVLGPTFLNHGYAYFNGDPPLITCIDLGQQVFMFFLGFVGYWAFTSRLQKRGAGAAALYAVRRFGLLYLIGFAVQLYAYPAVGTFGWNYALYDGVLAKLAFGSLAAYVATALIRVADRRFAFSMLLMALHALLYVFPIFDHGGKYDDVLHLPYFPFEALSLCALAIAGSCFAQWYSMDANDPRIGFNERIMPVTAAIVIASFCMDWLQPARHPDSTTALALMALGGSGVMIAGFYSGAQMGFRFPLLSALGRNLLLMFLLAGSFSDAYYWVFSKDVLLAYPLLAPLFGGLVPIALVAGVAVYLDRKRIYLRA